MTLLLPILTRRFWEHRLHDVANWLVNLRLFNGDHTRKVHAPTQEGNVGDCKVLSQYFGIVPIHSSCWKAPPRTQIMVIANTESHSLIVEFTSSIPSSLLVKALYPGFGHDLCLFSVLVLKPNNSKTREEFGTSFMQMDTFDRHFGAV